MASSPKPQSEQKKDPFQLAIPVAERVEILNVILASCKAQRSPAFAFKGDTFSLTTGVTKLGFSKNEDSGRLFVSPTFTVTLKDEPESSESGTPLSIAAKFVLVYSVKSFDAIDHENIRAFAAINGVFNAWPYWREFVQNTTARMGLPRPITVPVYRLGEAPFEAVTSDGDPSEEVVQAE
jgi:hypothetical protein